MTPFQTIKYIFRQNRLAMIGLVLLCLLIGIALITPVLPLGDPNVTHLDQSLGSPFSSGALLGRDPLGRDILSRLCWGLRLSLIMGFLSTLIAAIAGSSLGLISGFLGGWLDMLLMRCMDALMAFPYLLLALLIVAILGPGLFNALLAVALVNIPFFARTVRGAVLGLVHEPFVDNARLSGQPNWRIALDEILPNVMPLIVVTTASTVGWMILETAGLSFLGLGVQPPQADLGSMLGNGRSVFIVAPHVATLPGLVIVGIVLSINFIGDGIRDALDPRLRGGDLQRPQAKTAMSDRYQAGDSISGSTTELLQVQHLSVEFWRWAKPKPAVRDVSFELRAGDCLGLVGESGSGKSVTALALTALVASPPGKISAGQVHFQGRSLLTQPLSELQNIRGKQIAYIFQNPMSSLNPLISIGEQLTESILTHQETTLTKAKAISSNLLNQVELPSTASDLKRFPHQLSGGQQQRVAIAMALANQPDIIIADEPTTALDVVTQRKIVTLLKKIQRERQISLILISHDLGVVSQLCDRVAVIYGGEIVELGQTEMILKHPTHPYSKLLMECVPRIGQRDRPLAAIPGELPENLSQVNGCTFANRCPQRQERCSQENIPLVADSRQHLGRCLFPLESLV